MLCFRHEATKAQSGTKGRKKKKVILSASFCFCVFVAKKIVAQGDFINAYILNHYRFFH